MVLSDASEAPAPHPLTSGRPKDAATLLIVRSDGPDARVLMGRRHRGHAYHARQMGVPRRADRPRRFRRAGCDRVAPRRRRAPRTLRRPAPRARALACAAIRETFEETGLLLARPAAPVKRAGVWGPFLAAGALADLAALDFVARAITPPQRTRRFDARFFMADAGALVSLDPGSGSGELDELEWFTWPAAAALDLPRITRGILAEAERWRADRARPILFHRVVHRTYRSDPL